VIVIRMPKFRESGVLFCSPSIGLRLLYVLECGAGTIGGGICN
jgi:hypothetical protein